LHTCYSLEIFKDSPYLLELLDFVAANLGFPEQKFFANLISEPQKVAKQVVFDYSKETQKSDQQITDILIRKRAKKQTTETQNIFDVCIFPTIYDINENPDIQNSASTKYFIDIYYKIEQILFLILKNYA